MECVGVSTDVSALAFTNDEAILVSFGNYDNVGIELWNVTTGEKIKSIDTTILAVILYVAVSPVCDEFIVYFTDHHIRRYRITESRDNVELVWTSIHQKEDVTSLVFNETGTLFASCSASFSDEGRVDLWDGATGSVIRTLYNEPGCDFNKILWSADGLFLVACCSTAIVIFRANKWDEEEERRIDLECKSVCFSPFSAESVLVEDDTDTWTRIHLPTGSIHLNQKPDMEENILSMDSRGAIMVRQGESRNLLVDEYIEDCRRYTFPLTGHEIQDIAIGSRRHVAVVDEEGTIHIHRLLPFSKKRKASDE